MEEGLEVEREVEERVLGLEEARGDFLVGAILGTGGGKEEGGGRREGEGRYG